MGRTESTKKMAVCQKGKFDFDGRSDFSTYVVCKMPPEPVASYTAEEKKKQEELRDGARDICEHLFSGKVPRPPVGWWKRGEDEESSKNEDSINEDSKMPRGLWKPKAIISVTGGAQYFRLAKDHADNEKLMAKLSAGILKAAHALKAMIIDGGSSSGVMKLVGEAVERDGDRVATLGIFPYGALKEKTRNAFKSTQLFGPLEMRTHDAELDGNHHFFALIDDGSTGEMAWGKEIPSRYEIEYVLSDITSQHNGKHDSTEKSCVMPHVLLVVNGGPGTFDTALNLCQIKASQGEKKKKVIPIVVVENTGRAADLIAVTWRLLWEKDLHPEKQKALESQRQALSNELAHDHKTQSIKNEKKYLYLKQALSLCERQDTVTIYNFDDPNSLGYAMMRSICRGTQIRNEGPDMEVTDKSVDGSDSARIKSAFEKLEQERITVDELNRILAWHGIDGEYVDAPESTIIPSKLGESAANTNEANEKSNSDPLLQKKHDSEIPKDANSSGLSNRHPFRDLSPIEQLELVLAWQDFDGEMIEMAKREILYPHAEKLRSEPEYKESLKKLLLRALQRKKVRFVEALLDCEVPLPGKEEMEDLYSIQERNCPNERNREKTKKEKLHDDILRRMLRITKLRKSMFWVSADGKGKQESLNPEEVLSIFMGWRLFTPANQETTREHLFLWCLLTGRKEMAELFWRKCNPDMRQHCISRALFACAVARTFGPRMLPRHMSMIVSEDETSGNDDMASRFESIACEILDQCYKKSPEDAVLALTCPLLHPSEQTWIDQPVKGNMSPQKGEKFLTPIMLAFDAEAESFVEHAAFQECLDRIWFGRLVTRTEELQLSRATEYEGYRVKVAGMLSWVFRNALEDMRGLLVSLDIMILALLFFPVMLCADSDQSDPSLWKRVRAFCSAPTFDLTSQWKRLLAFYSAPTVKFYLDFASYCCFLLIYTYVGLNMDYEYTALEGVMHTWIISLALIEIRDWMQFGKRYMTSISNFFDFAILLFYIPAAVLRIYERATFDRGSFQMLGGAGQPLMNNALAVYPLSGEDFVKARSWHGMAGILFWIRLTDFFRVSQRLGPLMLVLLKVFWDAFQFFVILLIFIVSFGAAIVCAGRPRRDESISMAQYVEQIVFFPYLMIFGDHFMDDFPLAMDNYPLCNFQSGTCSTNAKLGIILMCLYLFISTILLMNLLIAMMNSSYSAVLKKSTRAWKFQRLEFVLSYSSKSIMPLPLSVVSWAFGQFSDLVLKKVTKGYSQAFIHLRKKRLQQYRELQSKLSGYATSEFVYLSNASSSNDTSRSDPPRGDVSILPQACPRHAKLSDSYVLDKVAKRKEKECELQLDRFLEVCKEDEDYKRKTSQEQNDELKNLKEEFRYALEAFAEGNTVGEIMYTNQKMMASLYQDVYLEDWWLQLFLEEHEAKPTDKSNEAEKETKRRLDKMEKKRAELMRQCANIVTSLGVKWISEHSAYASQSEKEAFEKSYKP